MISETTTWHGGYNPRSLAYEFQAVKTTESGKFAIVTTFELLPIDKIKMELTRRQPTLALYDDEAQSLFNALWNAGLRPRDGQGGLAHTNAQAAHIAELRAIVMKQCGVKQ